MFLVSLNKLRAKHLSIFIHKRFLHAFKNAHMFYYLKGREEVMKKHEIMIDAIYQFISL